MNPNLYARRNMLKDSALRKSELSIVFCRHPGPDKPNPVPKDNFSRGFPVPRIVSRIAIHALWFALPARYK
jgi:hypothetical protein